MLQQYTGVMGRKVTLGTVQNLGFLISESSFQFGYDSRIVGLILAVIVEAQ
jgi:hypothetical protein